MHKLVSLPLIVLTVVVALAGVAASGGIRAAGLNTWQALLQLAESLERQAEVEGERREAELHQQARDDVAADAMAGRISLPKAAARFRELNRQMADGGRSALNDLPGASEGEKLCRQVLERVKPTESNGAQPEAMAAYRRLASQLEELLQRDGVVHLPAAEEIRD